MNLVKLPLVTADAIVASNFIYFDGNDVTSVEVLATTFVIKTTARTITMTFDGADAAAKLLNVNNAAAYLLPKLLPLGGTGVLRKQSQKIFDVLIGMTIEEIHTAMTLTGTNPGTADDDGLVSIAIA
jgi:hypothetical protein